jgi:ribosome biogenesis GTPase
VLPQGGILMDTPGMRQIQLADCEQGVNETFSEIITLATQCRFNDCEHNSEPGCAVINALEKGELSPRRLDSYQKLIKEQAFNSATLAEKKTKDKAFGKMVNRALNEAKQFKRGE